MLAKARGDKRLRDDLIEVCRQDILFFINVFCFIFEPRSRAVYPWCTYGFQDEAIPEILDCIDVGEDLVIEKSRDMGASWMCIVVMVWFFLFHSNSKFNMVSRKEALVDDDTNPDSLFWKVDFLLKHLPDWMRPDYERKKMAFTNGVNNCTITGEATTGTATVGGRGTAVFVDELSRIPPKEAALLVSGTADTARCRIFNFTPFGTANAAYKLASRKDIRKLRLHWSVHPEKGAGLYRFNTHHYNRVYYDKAYKFGEDYPFVDDGKLRSPWYDEECRRRANDREVAQMLDIDYLGSSYQFFDRQMIADLQRVLAVEPYVEGDVTYDSETGKFGEWTTVKEGPVKLWMQLDGSGRPRRSNFVVACDVSLGTGATNSCATAIDVATGEKVMEYATPYLRAEQFATKVLALCYWLRGVDGEGAYLGWEMQGPGIMFGKRILELGYRNVYFRKNEFALSGKISDTPGWTPTPDNKRTVFESYRTALANKQMTNRSWLALEECLYFIHLPNGAIEHSGALEAEDPTGARINHGDRVVPDALAWKLAQERQVKSKGESTEVKVGSLAWRRELAAKRRREEELVWA